MKSTHQEPGDRERDLFLQALERSTSPERSAFLDGACGNDHQLRAAVETLLANHAEDDFLERAAVNPATISLPIAEKPGDRIGRYKLREKIGEGGYGVVYVAEQEEPVRRRVALKVIKLGMDSKSVVARFEAERQALAMMDHPNIAKVLDAGTTDTGRPYFVMELVRGIKITDYCDQNNLSTRERLDLFIRVCHAVQHAHQKGIIHRDLKPSNILVTLHDGVPVPKVIDFGIAKATEGRLTDLTIYTELHQLIGTPAYMSPEQAEMSGLDIDTRSDIYSLGVLLYELLTGKTPFSAEELLRAGFDEMRRTIREKEPARPSTRLSTMLEGELTATAKRHSADAPRFLHLVRGDLDWIVMKALEKDRTRRYETANGLAVDLKRHLNNEPVVARPPSAVYRFQKLVRRNKLAFAAATALSVVLTLGTAITSWQAWRATRERARAEASAVLARRAQVNAQRERGGADQARSRAETSALLAQRNLYASDMQLAQTAWRAGKIGAAVKLLRSQPQEFRGFDWRHLFSLCLASQSPHEVIGTDPSGFTAVDCSPDQRMIALGTGDGSIELYDLQRRQRVRRWPAHSGPVDDLACHPVDARWLITVSGDDGLLKIWDTTDAQLVLSTNGPRGLFAHLSINPRGNLIAAGAPSGSTVNIWNLDVAGGNRPTLTFQTNLTALNPVPMEVAFLPDDRTVVFSNFGELWSEVGMVDLALGHITSLPMVHRDLIFAAACSPDGRLLATGGADELVVCWDIRGRTAIQTHITQLIHVTSLVFSPDSRTLFACGWDQNILRWDLATRQQPIAMRGHNAGINALAMVKDGHSLVSAGRDGTARLWNLRTLESRASASTTEPYNTLLARDESVHPGLSAVFAMAVSPVENKVAAGTATGLFLLDVANGTQFARREWHQVFPGEGTNGFCGFAFSPDGRSLAVGSGLGRLIQLDATTLEPRSPVTRPHTNQIWKSAYGLNGKVLITGGGFGDGIAISDATTGNLLNKFDAIQGSFPGQPLAVSPDGRFLVAGSPEQLIVVRDIASGQIVARSQQKVRFPHALAFSPDGRTVAYSDELGGIFLWNLDGQKTSRKLLGHPAAVLDLAYSPDGRTLASTSMDHTIKLWHPDIEQEVAALTGHSAWVWCLAFAQQGNTLLTGSRDGTLKAWRALPFEEIASLENRPAGTRLGP